MRKIITALLLIIAFTCQAQEVSFVPKWKKGDKRKIYTQTFEKKWRKGELKKDDNTKMEANLLIKDVKSDYYILQFTYEDFALTNFDGVYEITGEKPDGFSRLDLIYHVSKDGKKSDLINWEDARSVVFQSFDEMNEKMGNRYKENTGNELADSSNVIKSLLNPFVKLWDSKEMMEMYFRSDIDALLSPYKATYSIDTVTVNKVAKNPFDKRSKMDSINTTFKYWVSNPKSNNITLSLIEIADTEDYKQLMKDFMLKFIGGFVKMKFPDTTSVEYKKGMIDIEKKLESINVVYNHNAQIQFDKKTGFVTRYSVVKEVISEEMNKTRRKFNQTIVEFK